MRWRPSPYPAAGARGDTPLACGEKDRHSRERPGDRRDGRGERDHRDLAVRAAQLGRAERERPENSAGGHARRRLPRRHLRLWLGAASRGQRCFRPRRERSDPGLPDADHLWQRRGQDPGSGLVVDAPVRDFGTTPGPASPEHTDAPPVGSSPSSTAASTPTVRMSAASPSRPEPTGADRQQRAQADVTVKERSPRRTTPPGATG